VDATAVSVVTSVIAAIAAIGAAYFGHKTSQFTAEAANKNAEIEELKRELRRAYAQVAAYYEVEALAAAELAEITGKSAKTVKSDLRDEVRDMGLDRPEWTRNECERRLGELG
jgi:DNA-directed RNA polymerase specialized sigma24 family protein